MKRWHQEIVRVLSSCGRARAPHQRASASLLQVVPEPVDTAFFDPTKHKTLPLPLGLRVFGPAWPHPQPAGNGGEAGQGGNAAAGAGGAAGAQAAKNAGAAAGSQAGAAAGQAGAAKGTGGAAGGQAGAAAGQASGQEPFVFLSVFKWEARTVRRE